MVSELEALVILTSLPHFGSVRVRQLVNQFGSAVEALEADPAALAKLRDFGPKVIQEWGSWKKDKSWKKNLELADRFEAEIIPYTSLKYPKRLLELPDYPILIYVQGELLPADNQSLAVVGTRQATIYGKEMAEKLSHDLAAAGFTIVSGLARGIDTAAHIGALKAGRTIAVIGSGLADIYPQENLELARAISKKGAVISEFPMATPPDRQNFPQRNRIVSTMTLGTVLIEAPMRSGAMITMDKALGLKRRLFALPGRADSETFRGNHQLIKQGRAQLIENASDIIAGFNDLFGTHYKSSAPILTSPALMSNEEDLFLNKLPQQEISIDEMVQLTKLPVMKVNVMVTRLVLKKVLKEFPGKVYKKCAVESRQGVRHL